VRGSEPGDDRPPLHPRERDRRVKAAGNDQWSKPSPCAEWRARDVVSHVTNNLRYVAATINGEQSQEDECGVDEAGMGETGGLDDPLAGPADSSDSPHAAPIPAAKDTVSNLVRVRNIGPPLARRNSIAPMYPSCRQGRVRR
jgi:hypothetical protein